jgi:CHRD domain/FG-GAP-like repeat
MRRRSFITLTIIVSAMMFSITAAAQQRFSISLNGRQEVPANNSSGNGACTLALNGTETQITVSCNYQNLTANVIGAHIHDNGPVGVSGPIRFDFDFSGGPSGTIGPLTFDTTPAQVADLRSNKWYINIHTSDFTSGEIRGQVKRANLAYDLDGDGRTDVVAYRRSISTAYTLNSLDNNITANPFGTGAGDNYVNNIPGDFDGDGRADYVIIKVGSDNVITWIILQTGTNTYRIVRWGGGNDAITPSDFDGDGKLDIATFRRTTGVWYILESSTGNPRYEFWGLPGDLPIIGDYDGDGKGDLCVMRAQAGLLNWYIRNSSNGDTQAFNWGAPGDSVFFFFQVDVDGDGKQDPMVQRNIGAQHVYYLRRSSDGQPYSLTWGLTNFFPLFGDYDGDGKTDFVARQTVAGGNGQYRWHIFESSTQMPRVIEFGQSGDQRPAGQMRQEPQVELPVGGEAVSEYR